MAELKFTHPDPRVVPWEAGAIVVLQIRTREGDGYLADTLETMPANIKELHADELEEAHIHFREQLGQRDAVLRLAEARIAELMGEPPPA